MKPFTVSSNQTVYAMSKDNAPVLTVEPGSKLVFEACDCFHNQIQSEAQGIAALDWERINPATGPVFIRGAEPGDAIKVLIQDIRFTGDGVMAAIPDVGIFGGEVGESHVKIMKVQQGGIEFGHGITLPLRPMIGVIGTAPKEGSIPSGTPGSHGGNMDCTKIAPGSRLYLPVFHPGGLLAMGDVHACMGDGEIMGTGVEIPADIHVVVELEKNLALTDPLLETEQMIYSIVSADSLEGASVQAARNIRDMVMARRKLGKEEAGMLLSAVGSLEICQIVDPQVTVRYGIAKSFLQASD